VWKVCEADNVMTSRAVVKICVSICAFMWLVANMLCVMFAMDAVLTTSAPKGNQMFLTKAAPGKGIHGSGL
jgi:hypothetical protein